LEGVGGVVEFSERTRFAACSQFRIHIDSADGVFTARSALRLRRSR
jgi:hypothetical protein